VWDAKAQQINDAFKAEPSQKSVLEALRASGETDRTHRKISGASSERPNLDMLLNEQCVYESKVHKYRMAKPDAAAQAKVASARARETQSTVRWLQSRMWSDYFDRTRRMHSVDAAKFTKSDDGMKFPPDALLPNGQLAESYRGLVTNGEHRALIEMYGTRIGWPR